MSVPVAVMRVGGSAHVHVEGLTGRSAGERAIYRVGTRNNGLTCEHMHRARHLCAQNVDHLAHDSPFSPVFAEVDCTLGTILL